MISEKMITAGSIAGNVTDEKAREIIEAAISAMDVEPFAWWWTGPRGGFIADTKKPDWPCDPLFATPQASAVKIDTDKAEKEFTAYFVKNYPGPDTVIFDPNWHAPKLFRAALNAIRSALLPDTGEVERLRAENDKLRSAMNIIDALDPEEQVYSCSADALRGLVISMGQKARAALEGHNDG